MARLADMLFGGSPYEGLDVSAVQPDLQGWGSDHYILVDIIEAIRPTRIIEVGSWKGRSAINMAKTVKRLGLDCEIVCVDTWLGSPEHWLKRQPAWYESLKIKHGMPHLYWTFLANVVHEGCADVITPFPSTSENAAQVLSELKITCDFCYIDAAHEYLPALRDFQSYWPLINDGGVLVGDDYFTWPGVTKAAHDFAKHHNVRIVGEPGKFMIAKGESRAVKLALAQRALR